MAYLIIIAVIIAFVISCVLNSKYNPDDNLPFRYGYFLSVITIFTTFALVITLIVNIMDSYRYFTSEIIYNILLILFGTSFLITVSVLNGKKYKIGAILVSIVTGNFVICIFYYEKRWHEFKTFSELKNNIVYYFKRSKINYDINNANLMSKWIKEYLNSTIIQKEKMVNNVNKDIMWTGTIIDVFKSSKKIDSSEISGFFIKTVLQYPLEKISEKIHIIFITNNENIALNLTKGRIFSSNSKNKIFIEESEKIIIVYITIDNYA
jgi:hypothetical protein